MIEIMLDIVIVIIVVVIIDIVIMDTVVITCVSVPPALGGGAMVVKWLVGVV